MLDRVLDIESCVREAEEATSSSSWSVNDSFTPSDIPTGNCSRLYFLLFSRVPTSRINVLACQLLSVLGSSAFSHKGVRSADKPRALQRGRERQTGRQRKQQSSGPTSGLGSASLLQAL